MEDNQHRSDPHPPNLGGFEEFDEIRPYEVGEMKQAFEELINDRQFSLLLKGFVPWLPKSIRNGLLRLAFIGVKTPLDFQLRFMKPIVWYFVRKYTDGLSFDDATLRQQPTANSQKTVTRSSPTTVTSCLTPPSSMSCSISMTIRQR